MPIVEAARAMNVVQRGRVIEKLLSELKILKGRTIGLLGLAFKAHTDDLRDSPSLDVSRQLLERGAKVKVHDPIALARARIENPRLGVTFCESAREVFEESDAVVLVTEWPEYRELPWGELRPSMRSPLILDGRNYLDREVLLRAGFHYIGFGR
jgi:UDPglucose 6-dehydrogenase